VGCGCAAGDSDWRWRVRVWAVGRGCVGGCGLTRSTTKYLHLDFPGFIPSSGTILRIHRVRPDLAGRCSRRRRRSAERWSLQATIRPATDAPSSLPPSTTPSASSSSAASPTTRSLPPGTLKRGSSPRTRSARSSAGSSKAGLSGRNPCQTELGWDAPACARRASGLGGSDGVRAGACAPAQFAQL